MRFAMRYDGQDKPYLKTAYQINIFRQGMLFMFRFVVPYGGVLPDTTEPFEYGTKAGRRKIYLKDLEAIAARPGDGDIVMTG